MDKDKEKEKEKEKDKEKEKEKEKEREKDKEKDENEEEEEEEAKQELTPEELAERERKEKERRERLYRLLIGCMQNLPSLGSKIVRIFTSSTFTDTTVERNALMERIYPKIKDFCRERYGLEFQVVDMRWGVRDEATDDHMTTQLCMQEIDNCQRLSMGPNFVVLLGQKYGYRPIPTLILATEFEMLRDCIKEEASELELLEMWYKRDDNYVPPVYVLQPISSILTNFNNKRHQRLQEADQATWWETFSKLTKIIRKAAQVLFVTKKIDREQMHNFFMSVTEREVIRGILKAPNVEDHCLAYVREISNINVTLLRFASKFIDFAARNVDNEAQKLLKALREKLPKKLPESNIARFTVEWSGQEGIDSETHRDYLEEFCNHFYRSVTGQVTAAMERQEKLSNDVIYSETLQHLHACQQFCRMFQGREEVVERVHQYVVGKSDQPFVMFGQSGCGKTSLMAKSASQVSSWFTGNKKPVMILRFLGTTPCSSSIVPLLTTLSRQLSYIYDIQEEEVPDELAPLIQHFKKVMCSATAKKPLIIFLDSLDQLSAASGAHELSWVPRKLAPNVKLIVSTLPNYYNILENLNTIVESKENYVQILPLGHNLSSTILKHWLKNANRNITNEQWEVVNEAISKCNLPLYVKLVFDEICRWKSYKKPQPNQLGHSIHDSITKLLEKIENQHGKTLVAHALGYITASKNGLSETELEDLLSLDEKVLNDVYQYHLPPTRRIPPLLWTRIRNDLPGYLSEREADGVNVIGWYHRQFIDAAKERYLKNLNFVSEIHSNLAEYFIGTWGGGIPKPFEYSELQRQRFNLDDKHGEGDRKVPLQPLVFNNAEGVIVTRYNLRKLSELPYSLIRSYRYEDLYEKVIFNYRWLHAKLSSMPLQSLLADLEDLLEHTYDKEVKLIADAIRLSSSVLNHYPDMLGPQIIGRLLPYYNSHQKIHSLIDQCESEGLNNCALIPGHHCLQTPGGPLQYSLEGHPFAPFGIAVTTDGRYVVSVSNKFIIWDLSSGDVVRTVSPKIEGIMQNLSISPSDKYAVGYTNNKQIVICLIYTGDYYIINEPDGKFKGQVLGATVSNSHLAVWKEKEWYLMTIEGKFLNSFESELKMPILLVTFTEKGNNLVFLKNDDEDNNAMTLEISDHSVEPFEFHSGIVLTKEQTRLYTCIEISDNAVVSYKLSGNRWRYERTLDNNTEPVFSMALAPDEAYLLVTIPFGYKLYDLKKDTQKDLKLPHGVRNIPTKNQIFSLLAFTKNNHFVVAGVRRNLYVWDVKQGNMVKVLDAHFGRIIAMDAVRGKNNKVISSSIDKTIKVWNFDNILEDVHSIDRLEKPIESMNIAENVNLCVTTTRNGVGVWDMERGKLVHNLPGGSHNSIISSALITKDGKYVVVAESVGVVVWDAKTGKMMKKIAQANTQVVLLNDDNTRVISFSVVSEEKGHGSCFIFPDGDEVYRFDYAMKKFLKPVLTCSSLQLAVPATDKSCDTINIYNAKTGHLQFTMQLKYSNYKDIQEVVAMPHEAHQIAVVDSEKGNIIDLKKKTLIRSVMRWNGMSTKNGKHGLYAPSRGGMELLELKHGKTIRTFIPKVAEGVFNIQVFFAKNDQHVVYYHSGRRTIRVFRVSDAKMIANFKTHAAVNTMACNALGTSIVIGTVDGSVTLLTIADPEYQENLDYLRALPARQALPVQPPLLDANGEIISSKDHFGATLHISRFVAKAGIASQKQQSKACVLS